VVLALLLGGMTVPAKAAETTTATISGVVTSAQGVPVAGAHVAAASPSGHYDGCTDAKGVFRLPGVQSDTYTVSVEARGFATAVQRSKRIPFGPPGYTGGNPLYAAAYQSAAGFAQPYTLGNGIPTNDGVTQAVPWRYGTAGYVRQGYPLARTFQLSLRYRI
jgi:hypothetical protein